MADLRLDSPFLCLSSQSFRIEYSDTDAVKRNLSQLEEPLPIIPTSRVMRRYVIPFPDPASFADAYVPTTGASAGHDLMFEVLRSEAEHTAIDAAAINSAAETTAVAADAGGEDEADAAASYTTPDITTEEYPAEMWDYADTYTEEDLTPASPDVAGDTGVDVAETYEGEGEGEEEERRQDVSNGGWYTRQEFLDYYGGTTEWEAAVQAEQPAQTDDYAEPLPPPVPPKHRNSVSKGTSTPAVEIGTTEWEAAVQAEQTAQSGDYAEPSPTLPEPPPPPVPPKHRKSVSKAIPTPAVEIEDHSSAPEPQASLLSVVGDVERSYKRFAATSSSGSGADTKVLGWIREVNMNQNKFRDNMKIRIRTEIMLRLGTEFVAGLFG